MCCDSPWVTTISCFIQNAASPQLINAHVPINDSHKTPSRPRLIPSHGQKKKKEEEKKRCCQTLPPGAADKLQGNQVNTGSTNTGTRFHRNCQKKQIYNMYEVVTSLLYHLWPSSFQVFPVFFHHQVLANIDWSGKYCCYCNRISLCGSSTLPITSLTLLCLCDH